MVFRSSALCLFCLLSIKSSLKYGEYRQMEHDMYFAFTSGWFLFFGDPPTTDRRPRRACVQSLGKIAANTQLPSCVHLSVYWPSYLCRNCFTIKLVPGVLFHWRYRCNNVDWHLLSDVVTPVTPRFVTGMMQFQSCKSSDSAICCWCGSVSRLWWSWVGRGRWLVILYIWVVMFWR